MGKYTPKNSPIQSLQSNQIKNRPKMVRARGQSYPVRSLPRLILHKRVGTRGWLAHSVKYSASWRIARKKAKMVFEGPWIRVSGFVFREPRCRQ